MGFAMALVVPKERKHLAADALFRLVRSGFDTLPEHRSLDTEIALTDALLSAFAMFSLQSPSLLAFDKERAEGNLQTIYGMTCVPCDTRMREILAPRLAGRAPPAVQECFSAITARESAGTDGLSGGRLLVALDGTGFVSSQTMPCASCLPKVHRHGSRPSSHQRLGAALLHPDGREVMPLRPAPIVKQDGPAKNDCERHAAKRLLVTLRQDHPHLQCIVTEDSLSSNAPPIEARHAPDLHDILGVKEGDHASLGPQVQAAAHRGRVTSYERHDHAAGLVHRVRFVHDVPLHASNADIRGHGMESWDRGPDRVQPLSWGTA